MIEELSTLENKLNQSSKELDIILFMLAYVYVRLENLLKEV